MAVIILVRMVEPARTMNIWRITIVTVSIHTRAITVNRVSRPISDVLFTFLPILVYLILEELEGAKRPLDKVSV